MKLIYKSLIILSLFFINSTSLKAETFYLDFKLILNQSDAGKKANQALKSQLDQGFKKLKDREKQLQKEEKEIIQQKKLLSPEEYKSKISSLRKKVSALQTKRNKLLDEVAKQRNKARTELLKNLNPIIKEYMKGKKIRLVLDKKSILLADENLDITKEITELLNKKLKSIALK